MFSRTDLSSYTSDRGVLAFFYRGHRSVARASEASAGVEESGAKEREKQSERAGHGYQSKGNTYHEGITQTWMPDIMSHRS